MALRDRTILALMGYYRPILVYSLRSISSIWLQAQRLCIALPGDLYLPHSKAHRVMLCPDGPDTGFVTSIIALASE